MADPDFRLNIKADTAGTVDKDLRKRINEIFNKHTLDAVDELQRNSPVGATRGLKEGWDILPARRSNIGFEVRTGITNTAPNALNRIVGREPGKFPPEAPVLAWVQKKLKPEARKLKGVTFLIRRKIAREGTQRWREKRNFAGLDLRGRPLPGSPIAKAEARIVAELNQLNLD